MRYIKDYSEELDVFSALGSGVRLRILELLLKNGRMSMNELADALGLTNGALTSHIKKLDTSGLVRINTDFSGHGNVKMCEPHLDKILFVFSKSAPRRNEYRSHIRVGQYSSCEVYPTCGLSTSASLIGIVDDPRFFTHQKHFDADVLWFTKGFVEYMVPCVIPRDSCVTEFSVSAEIGSEAPGSNPIWPSDIHFYINGSLIGVWTSPGDYADMQGLFTPDWWFSNWNQYGLQKTISVRADGTYVDSERVSRVTIDDLGLNGREPIFFRMAVPDTARHVGGLTIFGRGFGNYNQDIEFQIQYSRP